MTRDRSDPLDGHRGLAILLVVAGHIAQNYPRWMKPPALVDSFRKCRGRRAAFFRAARLPHDQPAAQRTGFHRADLPSPHFTDAAPCGSPPLSMSIRSFSWSSISGYRSASPRTPLGPPEPSLGTAPSFGLIRLREDAGVSVTCGREPLTNRLTSFGRLPSSPEACAVVLGSRARRWSGVRSHAWEPPGCSSNSAASLAPCSIPESIR